MGLQSENIRQLNLWGNGEGDPAALERNRRLMEVMDQINRQMGRGTNRIGTAGFCEKWDAALKTIPTLYHPVG